MASWAFADSAVPHSGNESRSQTCEWPSYSAGCSASHHPGTVRQHHVLFVAGVGDKAERRKLRSLPTGHLRGSAGRMLATSVLNFNGFGEGTLKRIGPKVATVQAKLRPFVRARRLEIFLVEEIGQQPVQTEFVPPKCQTPESEA